jgi:hypothetical protein
MWIEIKLKVKYKFTTSHEWTFIHLHGIDICDKGRLKGLIMGSYKGQ